MATMKSTCTLLCSVLLLAHINYVSALDHIVGFEPTYYIRYSESGDNSQPTREDTGSISAIRALKEQFTGQEACITLPEGGKNIWNIGTRSKVYLTPYVSIVGHIIGGWAFYETTNCEPESLKKPVGMDEAHYTSPDVRFDWDLAIKNSNEQTQLLDETAPDVTTFTPLQDIKSFAPVFVDYTNLGAAFRGTDFLGDTYDGDAALYHLTPEWVVMYKDTETTMQRIAYEISIDRYAPQPPYEGNEDHPDVSFGLCHSLPENHGIASLAILQYQINLRLQQLPAENPQSLVFDAYNPYIVDFIMYSEPSCPPESEVRLASKQPEQMQDLTKDYGAQIWDWSEQAVQGVRSIVPVFRHLTLPDDLT